MWTVQLRWQFLRSVTELGIRHNCWVGRKIQLLTVSGRHKRCFWDCVSPGSDWVSTLSLHTMFTHRQMSHVGQIIRHKAVCKAKASNHLGAWLRTWERFWSLHSSYKYHISLTQLLTHEIRVVLTTGRPWIHPFREFIVITYGSCHLCLFSPLF